MEKKTLSEILREMEHMDAGVLELDLAEMEALGENLKDKVDAYKAVIDYIDDRAKGLDERIKKMGENLKALKNQRQSILDRMAFVMSAHGMDKIQGQFFVASVRKSRAVLIDDEYDPQSYALEFPELVQSKTVYSWMKEPIKALLDKGLTVPWAKISDKLTVNFRLKSASTKKDESND